MLPFFIKPALHYTCDTCSLYVTRSTDFFGGKRHDDEVKNVYHKEKEVRKKLILIFPTWSLL